MRTCWSSVTAIRQVYQSPSDSKYAAEPSRSQPSSCAGSLSCWPRLRGTATKRQSSSGSAVMSPHSFSNCATGKISSWPLPQRSEEHTSELQSLRHLVCRLLLEKKTEIVNYEHHPRARRPGLGPTRQTGSA